jgi:hypothetical protein
VRARPSAEHLLLVFGKWINCHGKPSGDWSANLLSTCVANNSGGRWKHLHTYSVTSHLLLTPSHNIRCYYIQYMSKLGCICYNSISVSSQLCEFWTIRGSPTNRQWCRGGEVNMAGNIWDNDDCRARNDVHVLGLGLGGSLLHRTKAPELEG